MKPRVMIINPHFEFNGGAERQISELANHLTNHDYPITIFTTVACPEFKNSLKEARIIETGNEQNLVTYINAFARKFDIINPHNHPSELYTAYPLKVKKVWQCNEPPTYVLEGNPIDQNEKELIRRTTEKTFVISDYDRYRFLKIYDIEPIVNYPGVRYKYFSEKVKVRNTLNMKDNFVLTQVGAFTWTKNQTKSVEILAQVKKDISNAKLVLVGFGYNSPYGKSVDKKISELGLEDDVFINGGFLDDASMRNIYNQTSVFISPVMEQGGWATIFEAISAGVPTVVSEKFVAQNLIKDNNLGKLSPVGVEEFTNRIFYIRDNLERIKEETEENAKWLGVNLTWEKFGDKYMEVFEGII